MKIIISNPWISKSGKSINFTHNNQSYSFKKGSYNIDDLFGKVINIIESEVVGSWIMIREFSIDKTVQKKNTIKTLEEDIKPTKTKQKKDEMVLTEKLIYEIKTDSTFFEQLENINPLHVDGHITNTLTNENWLIKTNNLEMRKEILSSPLISAIQNFLLAKDVYKSKFNSDPIIVMTILQAIKYDKKYKIVIEKTMEKVGIASIDEANYWAEKFFKIAGISWEMIDYKKLAYSKSSNIYIVDDKKVPVFELEKANIKTRRTINFIEKQSVKYNNFKKSKDELNEILRFSFANSENKIKAFKDEQLDAISRIISSESNTLAVLKTGFGKSLIYQFVTLLQPRVFIVIFPIRSLISDQSKTFADEFGFNYSIDNENLKGLAANKLAKQTLVSKRVFLMTPERLENISIQHLMFSLSKYIGYMVFDEAHTISEWGHDFRPSFLMAKRVLDNLASTDKIITIALTATAAPHIQKDIANILDIKSSNIINIADQKQGLKRNEITYDIIEAGDVIFDRWNRSEDYNRIIDRHIDNAIRKYDQAIIFHIKAGSDTDENESKYLLKNNAYSSYARYIDRHDDNYPGLYTGKNKIINGEEVDDFIPFIDKKIIFATKSFGMGVNLRKCNYVLLTEPPYSLEDLYQQSGRVGRMGQKSTVEILIHQNVLLDPLNERSPYKFFLKIDRDRIMFQPEITWNLIQAISDSNFQDIKINISEFLGDQWKNVEFLEWGIAHLITQFKIIDTYSTEYKGMYKSAITIRPLKNIDVNKAISEKLARLRIENDGSLFDMVYKYYEYYFAKLQQDKLIGINIFINKIKESDISSNDDSEMISTILNEYYKTRKDESLHMVDSLFKKLVNEDSIASIIKYLQEIEVGVDTFDIMETASRYEINSEYIYLASLLINKVFKEKILAFTLDDALSKKYNSKYIKDNIYTLAKDALVNSPDDITISDEDLKEKIKKIRILRSINER